MTAVEQPASAGASWPLRITVVGLPPSPNRRMAWQARRRIVKPLAHALAWQASAGLRALLPRAEDQRVAATLAERAGVDLKESATLILPNAVLTEHHRRAWLWRCTQTTAPTSRKEGKT